MNQLRLKIFRSCLLVVCIWFLTVQGEDLDYPVSKRYKRARIANGSATILTDPIFEIFQNLSDLLLEDYHLVNEELAVLTEELDFYSERQDQMQKLNVKNFMTDYAKEMTRELEDMKTSIFDKNLSFISKVGFHFRSVLMMFTPIGKFEAPYKVFRKIFDFWFDKIVYFLPNLLGKKFFTVLLLFVLSLY